MKESKLIPGKLLDEIVKQNILSNTEEIFGEDVTSGNYEKVEIRSAHIVSAFLRNKGAGPDKSIMGAVGSLDRKDFLELVLSMYDQDGEAFMEDFHKVRKQKDDGNIHVRTNTMKPQTGGDDGLSSASSILRKLFKAGESKAKKEIFDALEKEADRAEFLANFTRQDEDNPIKSSFGAAVLIEGIAKEVVEKFEEDGHEDKIIFYAYFLILIASKIHAYCIEKYPNKEDYPEFIHGIFDYTNDVIKNLKDKKIIDSDDIPL